MNEHIGKRMTWDEIQREYPDKWVVLKDPRIDGSDIIDGVLVDVKSDDEIIPYRIKNLDKHYEYCRTTEGEFYGIVESDFNISII